MKTTLATLVVLVSTAAFADDYHRATPPPGTAYGVGYDRRDRDDRDDDDRDDYRRRNRHGGRDGTQGGGRFELRTTQRWVPGATTQVWVAGFCHRPPFSPVQVCTQGHYETRHQPGRYETVQQWVWVPHGHHNRWGRTGTYGHR